MALLEPQKCCILQWFLSLFGNERPPGSQRLTTGRPTAPKAKRPPGTFCFQGPKNQKTSQLGYQEATKDQPWLPHKGEGAPSRARREAAGRPEGRHREPKRTKKQNVPQGRFASGARKSKKTSQLGYQEATKDQPWLPHKGEGAPSLIVSSFFAPFVGLAS